MTKSKFIAQTMFGLEEVLCKELKGLGAEYVTPLNRAVSFEATQEVLYKIHLYSSLAIRVLKPFHSCKARSPEELYLKMKQVKWEKYMSVKDTLKIDPIIHSELFTHSLYAGLKVKDAVCDYFRGIEGKRPDVDIKNPTFIFAVHINKDDVNLYMDASGESLHRRKYRFDGNVAPLNEVLAAGIIALTNWKPGMPFLDGMTGSGTLTIETLFKATNTPPAIKRRHFGFMNWPDFKLATWKKVVREAEEEILYEYPNVIGMDIDGEAIRFARENMVRAGFKPIHHLKQGDFFKYVPKEKEGVLVLNPPYDVRLVEDDICQFYEDIGNHIKHNFTGWTVWIITANEDARKSIGLKPSKKIKLYNGKLACQLQKFEMY